MSRRPSARDDHGVAHTDVSHERVAALVATELLRAAPDAIDETITRAFAQVALHRAVDRAYYYRLDEAAGAFDLTHEWHAPTLRPMRGLPSFTRLPLTILPDMFLATLRRGDVLSLPRTRGMLAAPVDQIVAPDGDRALVLVPVLLGGVLLGVAGFAAACDSAWVDGDIELLHVAAQGVARAVERRRVDDALRISEARFRAMCDSSPLGVFLADTGGDCLYVNAAGERICGLSADEARGPGWMSSLHPEDRARIVARWGSAVGARAGYDIPIHRFIHKNGDVRFVAVRAVPLAGTPGGEGFLGILEDVTDRQRAESERRELFERAQTARADAEVARAEAEASRAEIAAIVSRIADAFVALDRDGRYRYVNDPAVVMMGHPRERLIGREPWVVDRALEGGAFHTAFLRAVREQQAVSLEAAHPDGKRHYEIRVYPSPTGASVFAEEITERKRREEELSNDREYLRQEVGGLDAPPGLVGFGDGLGEVLERVSLVAAGTTSVLITGETGTGKELVARAIHERSPRRARLLVKVNCAAISSGLVESELFGHEKGAFTGALARRKGRFELAHGGTLFLDEVGELPLDLQAKLLRVLQERELERVGGSETVRVDVRVLAATNRNLVEMIAQGKFREDLYYRLNVFPLALPPVRERAGDIPILAHAFLRRFARQAGRRLAGFTPEAMQRLEGYRWPGNVRELQNVIERAVILAVGPTVGPEALPDLGPAVPGLPVALALRDPGPGSPVGEPQRAFVRAPRAIDEVERDYVARTLAETEWIIEGDRGAARRLGLHPNTLRSRLKRWGLRRPSDVVLAAS
jgi:formate hydrogenlyase transcriptional activator